MYNIIYANSHISQLLARLPHACSESKSAMRYFEHNIEHATIADFYADCKEFMWLIWVAVEVGVDDAILLDVIERLEAAKLFKPDMELKGHGLTTNNFVKKRPLLRYYYVISDLDTFSSHIAPIVDRVLAIVKGTLTLNLLLEYANKPDSRSSWRDEVFYDDLP